MSRRGTKTRTLQHELEQMAADIFETKEEAAQWLCRPHPMLKGEVPLQMAKTLAGAERVKEILTAIKFGFAL